MDMEEITHYLKRNRVMLIVATFLVLGSGCAGVVKQTGDQLTEDALAPIAVPVREGTKAIDKLEGIQAGQEAHNAELEEIQ